MMRSRSSSEKICSTASTFVARLKCESMMPLGTPVLPLEKITVARLSGSPLGVSQAVGR